MLTTQNVSLSFTSHIRWPRRLRGLAALRRRGPAAGVTGDRYVKEGAVSCQRG